MHLKFMIQTNPCTEVQCPIQFVLDLISSKWSVLILRELLLGNRRTHELQEALPGISRKVLTQRLRELEAYDLVERRVYPEVPPHVEYALTPKGRELEPVMQSLYAVGHKWLAEEACHCSLVPFKDSTRTSPKTIEIRNPVSL